jgi:hypothetical protein
LCANDDLDKHILEHTSTTNYLDDGDEVEDQRFLMAILIESVCLLHER